MRTSLQFGALYLRYVSVYPGNVDVRYNDLSSTDVAVNSTIEDGQIDARMNYFGEFA